MPKKKDQKSIEQMEGEKSYFWFSRIVKLIPEMLFEKALKGHIMSTGLLWELATFSIDNLRKLARVKPEILKPIAANQHEWPGFIGPHRDLDKHNRDLVKLLEVGSNSEIKLHSKTKIWSRDTYANEVILGYYYLFSTIKTNRRPKSLPSDLCFPNDSPIYKDEWREKIENLPALNSKSAAQWFDAIWQFIMEEYNDHPEKNPPDDPDLFNLWPLGEHREFHSEFVYAQKTTTPATSAANIRDGIKGRLKRAFIAIVR